MNYRQILAFVEPQAKRRLQMIPGQVVEVLAACVQFLAIPILTIVIFAALMIAEVGNRRRPEMHQPCVGDVEPAG